MKSNEAKMKKSYILILFCVSISILMSLLLSRQQSVLIGSDHYSRWYATYRLIKDNRSIYDPQNSVDVVSLNSSPTDPLAATFSYPAHLLFFILPFVLLPYPIAHFLWLVIIQLFIIIAIWLLYRELDWPETINQFTLFLILSIFFIPNIQNVIWGQFNSISVISLVIIILAIRREEYFIAGLCSIGLTFKPQTTLFVLGFLVFWSIFSRKRWHFLLGLGLSLFGSILFANWYEPNWILLFIEGVQDYSKFFNPKSVFDSLIPHSWILYIFAAAITVLIFLYNRKSSSKSSSFNGSIVYSLGIGWLTVPVLGMMNLVAFPIALILLFSSFSDYNKKLYRLSIASFSLIYFWGLVGFIYGLSSPNLYGQHIHLSELAYKIIASGLLILFSIPLTLSSKTQNILCLE